MDPWYDLHSWSEQGPTTRRVPVGALSTESGSTLSRYCAQRTSRSSRPPTRYKEMRDARELFLRS
jgi:hypothetical protein